MGDNGKVTKERERREKKSMSESGADIMDRNNKG